MKPLAVFTGPKQPVYSVAMIFDQVVILEDGRPVDIGRPLTDALDAVLEASRIAAVRYRHVGTCQLWPAKDPQRLPARVLRIAPARPSARWN